MNMDELLHVATYAGKIMLESGGETHRAEDIILRICNVYGAEEAESFVTTTGIMVSICKKGKTYSLIRRVSRRTIDLHKIDEVNALSRKIQDSPLNLNVLYEELKLIDTVSDRYSNLTTLLISALGAFCFVVLSKGTFRDAIAAFFVGFLIKCYGLKFPSTSTNQFFANSISAGLATLFSIIFYELNFIQDVDKTIIGSIMLLVPGLTITNAIRDTIHGDLLAGLTRGAEAFLIAVSIAVGTGSVLSFWISLTN